MGIIIVIRNRSYNQEFNYELQYQTCSLLFFLLFINLSRFAFNISFKCIQEDKLIVHRLNQVYINYKGLLYRKNYRVHQKLSIVNVQNMPY